MYTTHPTVPMKIAMALLFTPVVCPVAITTYPSSSSTYYRSITHSIFRVGVGLSFSNSTEEVDHMVLASDSTVQIQVTRGPAVLVADNTPQGVPVAEGDTVVMRQTAECALVYDLAGFMCPACRALRHHR